MISEIKTLMLKLIKQQFRLFFSCRVKTPIFDTLLVRHLYMQVGACSWRLACGQRWSRTILTVRNVYLYIYIYISCIYRYTFLTVRIARGQRCLRPGDSPHLHKCDVTRMFSKRLYTRGYRK